MKRNPPAAVAAPPAVFPGIACVSAALAAAVAVAAPAHAATLEVEPSTVAVEREGVTGAGWAVVSGEDGARRVTLHYPNHPDDFGASSGTGTAHSFDDGVTWSAGEDDWPLADAVDLWQTRLDGGSLLAFGIRWLPDPARRREIDPSEVPGDAFRIALSRNGREWAEEASVIECPPEIGVLARPLPRIFSDGGGSLFMPAYAWRRGGNCALLLESGNGGRLWRVRSLIATAVAMSEAGAAVTTPWLESAVSPASDGSWIAVVRTGSNERSGLMSARSTDRGRTWSPVEPVVAGQDREPVAGKLPGLLLFRNGALVLLTAHSRLGCRIHLSADGTGREWSEARLVAERSGGNTSMVALDENRLLVFTPENRRIRCWRVTVRP